MCNFRKASMLLRKRNIKTRFVRCGIYADICIKNSTGMKFSTQYPVTARSPYCSTVMWATGRRWTAAAWWLS